MIKGVGAVGAFGVSGLPEREDHGVIVDTLCDHLGIKRKTLALPAKSELMALDPKAFLDSRSSRRRSPPPTQSGRSAPTCRQSRRAVPS